MKHILIVLLMTLLAACQIVPHTQIAATKMGFLMVRLQTDYQIQAMDAVVSHITFTLTGANVISTASIDVPRSQFQNNCATVRWDKLLPGPVHLAATIYDSQERILAHAEGNAEIQAEQTAELALAVVPMIGSLVATMDVSAWIPSPSVQVGE